MRTYFEKDFFPRSHNVDQSPTRDRGVAEWKPFSISLIDVLGETGNALFLLPGYE